MKAQLKILSEAFGSFTYDAFIAKGLILSYDFLNLMNKIHFQNLNEIDLFHCFC